MDADLSLEAQASRALADAIARNPDPDWCNGAPPANAPCTKPVTVSASGLLSAHFPKRERLLDPWLVTQSLSMIYAPRGIGKTHFAMGLGCALATGGEFLGWRARTSVPVLYVDGEMPGADLQKRLAGIVASNGGEMPDALRFMTPDLQPDGIMPNLYAPAGQQAVGDAAEDCRVIIVDNLSCMVRGGKENEGESWQPVAEWALRMRHAGRSVVFIHHAGKGGQQRGTSKREDLLDIVIALRRPADYTPEQGARFEVHFEKARPLYGQDVTPFEAALHTDASGAQSWAMRDVADASEAQMIELSGLGLTTRDIGSELGVSHSTVVRALNKAKEEGRYAPREKKPRALAPERSDGEAYRRASRGE